MATITVKLTDKHKDVLGRIRRGRRRSMPKLAAKITAVLRKSLNTPYPPASVPPNKPHRRTGNLRDKTFAKAVNQYSVRVYSQAHYSSFMEEGWGDRRDGKAARPFLLQPLIDKRLELRDIIKNELQSSMREA